jgi:exonuclease V gamma subunit
LKPILVGVSNSGGVAWLQIALISNSGVVSNRVVSIAAIEIVMVLSQLNEVDKSNENVTRLPPLAQCF